MTPKRREVQKGTFANSGLPPPHRCGSPIPIPFHGFSPSVLSQKFNIEQRVKVGPLTPFSFVCVCVFSIFFFFSRMTLMRSTERYKLLCKMVKSFIRHQQSKQLTSCMFYFSTIPVGFMQKEKKNVQFFWFIFFLCWSAFCSRRRCLRFYLISLPSQLPLCASNFNWLHGGYGGACHPGIFSLLCTQNKQKKKQYRKQQKKQNNTMHNAAIFIKQRLQNCWVSLYNMLFMLFNIPLHVAFIPSPLVTLY